MKHRGLISHSELYRSIFKLLFNLVTEISCIRRFDRSSICKIRKIKLHSKNFRNFF